MCTPVVCAGICPRNTATVTRIILLVSMCIRTGENLLYFWSLNKHRWFICELTCTVFLWLGHHVAPKPGHMPRQMPRHMMPRQERHRRSIFFPGGGFSRFVDSMTAFKVSRVQPCFTVTPLIQPPLN